MIPYFWKAFLLVTMVTQQLVWCQVHPAMPRVASFGDVESSLLESRDFPLAPVYTTFTGRVYDGVLISVYGVTQFDIKCGLSSMEITFLNNSVKSYAADDHMRGILENLESYQEADCIKGKELVVELSEIMVAQFLAHVLDASEPFACKLENTCADIREILSNEVRRTDHVLPRCVTVSRCTGVPRLNGFKCSSNALNTSHKSFEPILSLDQDYGMPDHFELFGPVIVEEDLECHITPCDTQCNTKQVRSRNCECECHDKQAKLLCETNAKKQANTWAWSENTCTCDCILQADSAHTVDLRTCSLIEQHDNCPVELQCGENMVKAFDPATEKCGCMVPKACNFLSSDLVGEEAGTICHASFHTFQCDQWVKCPLGFKSRNVSVGAALKCDCEVDCTEDTMQCPDGYIVETSEDGKSCVCNLEEVTPTEDYNYYY